MRRPRPRRARPDAGLRQRLAGRARAARSVAFAWAPNRLLPPAYLLSLVACLVLLGVLLAGAGRPAPEPAARRAVPQRRARLGGCRWPARRGGRRSLAAVVLGFVFAIRAGLVLGPLVALVLALGVAARRLALTAGALLARRRADPLPRGLAVRDPGGFNSNLAVERIAAHWVGVAAVVLLGAALWRVPRGGACAKLTPMRIVLALLCVGRRHRGARARRPPDRCEDARREVFRAAFDDDAAAAENVDAEVRQIRERCRGTTGAARRRRRAAGARPATIRPLRSRARRPRTSPTTPAAWRAVEAARVGAEARAASRRAGASSTRGP